MREEVDGCLVGLAVWVLVDGKDWLELGVDVGIILWAST